MVEKGRRWLVSGHNGIMVFFVPFFSRPPFDLMMMLIFIKAK